MNIHKGSILVLNKSFFPLRIVSPYHAFIRLSTGAYHAIDFDYNHDEEGNIKLNEINQMIVIKSMDEWSKLPIRPFDEYITTPNGGIRIPPIVVCSKYNRIRYPRVQFPTNTNIFIRDKYTCQYTGKKLSRDQLSVDHVIPRSRGGANTWENMVTCERELNGWKSDRTPQECGIKLISKPTKPQNGMIFEVLRDEWETFVKGFKG